MASVKKYNDIQGIEYILNKNRSVNYYINYTLNRTLCTFSYKNLPDTIPQKELERLLQANAHCIIAEYNGKLYAFSGSFTGLPDVYGLPDSYQVNNVALNLNKKFKIDVDCVLIRNDSMLMGLVPLINRYAILLTENDISIRTGDILLRMIAVISAGDERTRKSAEEYVNKIANGDLTIIGENAFTESLKLQKLSDTSHSYLTQFIEVEQYLKGSMYNELGINANYNMKRGNITTGETMLDADLLNTFTDNMLYCRQEAVEKINKMFNTNIEVGYSPSWEKIKGKDLQEESNNSSTKQIVDEAVEAKVGSASLDTDTIDMVTQEKDDMVTQEKDDMAETDEDK